MYKLISILGMFLLFSLHPHCQDASFSLKDCHNLIYYYDGNNNNSFLVPFIETELKKLKNSKEEGKKIFENVDNLNLLLGKKEKSNKLTTAFQYFNRNRPEVPNLESEKLEKPLAKIFENTQFFLQININTLNSLIEFQFSLFQVIASNGSVGDINPGTYRTTSVFIDPTSTDYKQKIISALRQIIFEADAAPAPVIQGDFEVNDDTIYLQAGKQTTLIASQQDDTPEEQISYHWEFTEADKKYLLPSPNSKIQSLNFSTLGVYPIILTVNDGINTRSKTFSLVVMNTPFTDLITSNSSIWNFDTYKKKINFYSFFKKFDGTNFPSSFISASLERSFAFQFDLYSNADTIQLYYLINNGERIRDSSKRLLEPCFLQRQPSLYCLTDAKKDSFKTGYKLRLNELINTPTTTSFVAIGKLHGIKNDDLLTFDFHKLSRVMPTAELFFSEKKDSASYPVFGLRAGVDYLVTSDLTLTPMVGISSFDKAGKETVFSYRLALLYSVFASRSAKIDIGLNYLNQAIKTGKDFSLKQRENVMGIGLQVKFFQAHSVDFLDFYNGPRLTFTYYPKKGLFTNSDRSSFEIALKQSFVIEAKSKRLNTLLN